MDLDNLAGFYDVDPSNPASSTSPNQISPNLKPTTVDEFVVGADQELPSGLTASVHYTYRSIRAIVFSPYIGVTSGGGGYEHSGNASGSVTDPFAFGFAFDVPYFGLTLDPPPTGVVLENRPGYGQTYQGVGLQLVKPLSDRWLFRGTVSWNSWTQSVSPERIFDPNNGLMRPEPATGDGHRGRPRPGSSARAASTSSRLDSRCPVRFPAGRGFRNSTSSGSFRTTPWETRSSC